MLSYYIPTLAIMLLHLWGGGSMTGSECITGYVWGSTKLAYVECLALCLMYKKELSKYSSLKRIFFLHIIMQILFVSYATTLCVVVCVSVYHEGVTGLKQTWASLQSASDLTWSRRRPKSDAVTSAVAPCISSRPQSHSQEKDDS